MIERGTLAEQFAQLISSNKTGPGATVDATNKAICIEPREIGLVM